MAGLTPGFRERQATVGAVTLNFVEGPDAGLPLLLIPGQMESWHGYKRVLPALARDFHVYVVEVRGQGKSSRTPGRYSYNACGEDLLGFVRTVIGRPALVSGLSSGAVLALWLAAKAPNEVLAVISEDPPIYSSVLPRVRDEPFMQRNFRIAADVLGAGEARDLERYFSLMGAPDPRGTELRIIPPFIVKVIFGLYRWQRRRHPDRPYDAPLLPFDMRVGLKFLSEYDPDFSRATADGELGDGFDPDDTLKGVACPTLLLKANATRHPHWGILGALDESDLERVVSLVDDIRVMRIPCRHEIHLLRPRSYLSAVQGFVAELHARGGLPTG